MTPRDLIFFTLAILIAGLIGYLITDRLCPRNYPRWMVWALAPATGFGICSLIVFFFRRPMTSVEAMLLTIFILLFCELGPKAIAARYPEQIAMRVVIPVEICMRVLSPLAKAGIKVSGFFFRRVKNRAPSPGEPTLTGDELRALLAGTSHREESTRMIERVLEFSERQV